MPPLNYHFGIHKCEDDTHYHIVARYTDPENQAKKARISEPFWTFFGGMKAIDRLCLLMLHLLPKNQRIHLREEITELKNVLWGFPKDAYRDGYGLPQSREATVPEAWSKIFKGENANCVYPRKIAKGRKKVEMLPFICDFIDRPAEEKLNSKAAYGYGRITLRMLAREKAEFRPLDMLERQKFQAELRERSENAA